MNSYLNLLAYFGIGGAHPGGFTLTQSIMKDENIKSSDWVLDIGCGTGQTAAFIAKQYDCNVTGIDNHPLMVSKAKERISPDNKCINIIEGDVQNLDLADHSFDLIISESVIVFNDIPKTLKELSRVLKTDGRLIMIEMTAEQYLTEEIHRKACGLYGISKVLTEDQWKLNLQLAGFNQIAVINTPSELTETEITDINPSEDIDHELFDLWDEHTQFIQQFGHLFGYRVYRCRF